MLCILAVRIPVVSAQTVLPKGNELAIRADGEGSAVEVEITAGLKGDRQHRGMSQARWGIAWNDNAGNTDSLVMQWGNTDFGMENDRRFLRVKSGDVAEEFAELHPGQETLYVSVSLDSREVVWCVAQDRVMGRGRRLLAAAPEIDSLKVFTSARDLQIERLEAKRIADFAVDGMTRFKTSADIVGEEDITQSPAGVWRYLDRDNDPAWSRPGGKYTLGIVRDEGEKDAWTIVYLGGAVTNSDRWSPGMRKGSLKGSGFLRDFNLEWIDAMCGVLGEDDECSAALSDDGQILTLRFPLDKATLRFSRQP